MPDQAVDMLLVEPVALLRRTVCLTARQLGLGDVHEAANDASALKLIYGKRFHGAIIALDPAVAPKAAAETDETGHPLPPLPAVCEQLKLIDAVRSGLSACSKAMPIAVMVDVLTPELVADLTERDIERVIIRPIRARELLDTFAEFAAARRGS